ncbi:hypothetical protein B188_06630 [Candidatus Brocadiaceae bacterium B188]|nr:hypothetical protein B188_06630 [Candidatus Brocadiaceae bacterium B188]
MTLALRHWSTMNFGVHLTSVKNLGYVFVHFYTLFNDSIVICGQCSNYEEMHTGDSINRGVEAAADYQAVENRMTF